jgi:dipeptidyl aminopeptidase/acylaminoacyl peptidase
MHKLKTILFSLVLLWSCFSTTSWALEAGIAPEQLREMVKKGGYTFTHERENPATEGIRRDVFRYEVDGLQEYALVLWPAGESPDKGWPIVQFNHGFHPDPPRNGFVGEKSDRPGDYYRETIQAFARAGYVVVAPDYRGHNISQGGEFTTRILADAWYARDAIGCFLALESLPDLDLDRAYMLGHSMGGPITLRALLALGERVRAGAIWSTSGVSKLSSTADEALKTQATQLQVPLSIQHAQDDRSAPVESSLELADRLDVAGKTYQLKVHAGDDHLFTGEMFKAAVARDNQWFQRQR